jgi:hypothetical protein
LPEPTDAPEAFADFAAWMLALGAVFAASQAE